jgi:hypothetical protein
MMMKTKIQIKDLEALRWLHINQQEVNNERLQAKEDHKQPKQELRIPKDYLLQKILKNIIILSVELQTTD